ncbi:TRAP transporter small permease subunit [Roseitranquillus sediminis]|uniref:TRAP transporter small permease subunit n=1 Tax=Roseitranquillus sediminis TaxID=2809051 RepID=UPI001D0CA926|nr:TRAP transporter small permease subunit [Roseitranquillus sediminis]MBM9594152.1 C4-dicarboxylate ABC transporter permease [Roseitranquillus sediminis]
MDFLIWVVSNIALSFWRVAYAVTHPGLWLDWSNPEAVMRFAYYGGSREFLFVVLTAFLVLTGLGFWRNRIMWGAVRVLEAFANGTGRFFAWAGLLMVLQQIVIIFSQSIFAMSELTFGLGAALSLDISWWSEELKFYNALVVALCCTYTFVQGGHVRVDLVYSAVGHRTKRVIDMAGSLVFMMPFALIVWMYAWYFLWRHLVTPKVSASDSIDQMLMKARAFRWNVETVGFSPNGFNGYFLFKVLLVAFAGMVFLQAVAFFYRSYLEWKEGPASAGRFLDRDVLEPGEVEMAAPERHAH